LAARRGVKYRGWMTISTKVVNHTGSILVDSRQGVNSGAQISTFTFKYNTKPRMKAAMRKKQ